MSLPTSTILPLIGLLYTLAFGGLSLLRREGLPIRFAFESILITVIATGLYILAGLPINPVLFLVILYAITMRTRLLVDVGNMLARRGNFQAAAQTYRLALRLWPDDTGRLITQIDQGVLALQLGRLDEAIDTFKHVLDEAAGGYLGIKHESGCHYNLAVAYQRQGLEAQATLEFNATLDTYPGSEHARRAAAALERHRHGKTTHSTDQTTQTEDNIRD